MTTASPVLAPVPAWRRPAYWLFFALEAWWGAVLGSAGVGRPFVWNFLLPDIGPSSTQRFVDNILFAALGKASSTQLGATLVVWTFTLGGGLLVGMWGLRWRNRSQPGGALRMGEP